MVPIKEALGACLRRCALTAGKRAANGSRLDPTRDSKPILPDFKFLIELLHRFNIAEYGIDIRILIFSAINLKL